jgi:hypothetical protein
MTKNTLILISISVILISIFLFWTAKVAKQKSEDILSQFKHIDSSLQKSKDSLSPINSNNTNKDIKEDNIEITSAGSKAVMYIDSLREFVKKSSDSHTPLTKVQIRTLKTYLLDFNSAVNSRNTEPSDSLALKSVEGNGFVNWDSLYFYDTKKEIVHTYLTYLENTIIKIQSNHLQH